MYATAYHNPKQAEYELRERCGKRAEEIFSKYPDYEKILQAAEATLITSFENHYSTTLNECFSSTSEMGTTLHRQN